jgi:hypothetical protein
MSFGRQGQEESTVRITALQENRELRSGLETLSRSLQMKIQALLGFARACKYLMFKPISLLGPAQCRTVFAFRWCQYYPVSILFCLAPLALVSTSGKLTSCD